MNSNNNINATVSTNAILFFQAWRKVSGPRFTRDNHVLSAAKRLIAAAREVGLAVPEDGFVLDRAVGLVMGGGNTLTFAGESEQRLELRLQRFLDTHG